MASFAEPERLTLIFDAPDREDWQKTSRILAQMDLQPAMRIADVGAGTGYFSQLFAERVPDGRVYALDNEPNMVAHMQRRFADAGTAQVEVRQSQAADPCLPAGLDWVFMANVYRFIADRAGFLARLHAQMAERTRGLLVDFKGSPVVPAEVACAELQAAGFVVSLCDLDTCPDHFVLHFARR